MSRLAIEIDGFPELLNKIKQLSDDKDKRRETLLLLRQVARPTLEAARLLAPVNKKKTHYGRHKKKQVKGNLKKSLGFINSKSENPTVLVGARVKGKFDGYYAHFVTDGHEIFNQARFSITREKNGRFLSVQKSSKSRANKKGSKSQGKTRANPFLNNAYAMTKGNVTADAEVKMARFIQRRIDKLS